MADYENIIKEVLSSSNGLTFYDLETKVLKTLSNYKPPERFDFMKFYATLSILREKKLIEKKGKKYFLTSNPEV